MKSMGTITALTLGLAFPVTAMDLDPIPEGKEKCYGIADAGQNDGPFMADYPEAAEGAGGSKYPCERTAWRWVPKGKCINIMIGFTEDNTALTGTLEPRPEGVNPAKCMPYMVFGDEDDSPKNANAQPGKNPAQPNMPGAAPGQPPANANPKK